MPIRTTCPIPAGLCSAGPAVVPCYVVVAENRAADELIVVTLHEPDPALWRRAFAVGASMNCVVCRRGRTRPGAATLVLERGHLTLVLKKVPAEVCENCGEEFVDEAAAASALASAERALADGVTVQIREFETA